jgi:hypothetical protein
LIKDFHEFDTIPEAKKYVIRHKLITWELVFFAWDMLGDMAEGTTLHGYGESLFNKWGMQAPDPRHALWRIYTKS